MQNTVKACGETGEEVVDEQAQDAEIVAGMSQEELAAEIVCVRAEIGAHRQAIEDKTKWLALCEARLQ